MKNIKIHFVGIGGSGMSGVAMIAHSLGYEVTGCDLNTNTPYIEDLKKTGIKIFDGHNENHLNDIDIVAVSPSVYFQNYNHPEVLKAKKEDKIMTWQKFLGEYLQKGKKVICIAGTHGKSTTTAMASLLFEQSNLDPSVMIGANIKEWNSNYRVGKSNVFITEADEFFNNFLNYSPDIIILNNIEFDHPDFFKDEKQMFESFGKFILNLKSDKILIYNEDDEGIQKLFKLIGEDNLNKLNLHGYTTGGKKIKLDKDKTEFEVDGDKFILKILGKFNVSNALGVISLAKLFGIPTDKIKKSLGDFTGIGRRMELIGDRNGTKIYDDYAHHPTAIKETLKALRQKYPDKKILAIIEPHTFSRTKALLPLYKNSFNEANEVIIAPIFKSRDTENFGINSDSIVKVSNHKNIKNFNSFDEIKTYVSKNKYDVIIVMGAGESYKLSREIYER